ncbi:hypothetical protein KPL35_06085 [Clostridium sp. CF011]|uniref:hypothetical protein n=1 Tax=Clostridium sp. CF011 TaxID=2843318 RepID=UPI001C0D95A1|nr:hypothetical protein [Clostridium sp. CF011]MBU3091642.1 hypothetical protein [Clostridium sp. CF011]WAG69355.1 hypothetical protein LL036_15345 [Clostridium sp. CF011]
MGTHKLGMRKLGEDGTSVIYGKYSRYIISKNEKRKENMDFIEDYKINTQKEKEILLGLQYNVVKSIGDNLR